jgi:hypothetical protein
MKKDIIRKIILILTVLGLGFAVYRAVFPKADGYTSGEELRDFGISGREKTWSFCEFTGIGLQDVEKVRVSVGEECLLSLDKQEDDMAFIQAVEDMTVIVDQRPRKKDVRYDVNWVPYMIRLILEDGRELAVGISSMQEISRVLCYEEQYYEMVAPKDFYYDLEKLLGMKPYP